ncbi:MAG: peptidoglycan recognition protein family protein [Chloroflexia bacterium]
MSEPSSFSRRTFLKGVAALGTSVVIGGVELRLAPAAAAAVGEPSIAGCTTWGAAPPTQAITVLANRPNKIIVHHTATANSTDYSQAHAFALARSIQQAHFANGWIDSGQHFTISRGGYAMEGRHRSLEEVQLGQHQVQGAHCPGQNDVAVGIENEGTYTAVQPPNALYNQLVAMCAYLCQQYGIPSSQIYGHRDFIATDCPGDQLYAMLPRLRSDVAARLGTPERVWPLVQYGDSGERVKTVQYLLRAHGYSLTVDGSFGSGTKSTVQSFQSSHGLTADGIVGANTWEALVVTVQYGSSGDAVRAAQSQLVAHGYSLTVDGSFGNGTKGAVQSFQSAHGLSADGVVGPDTWSALVR